MDPRIRALRAGLEARRAELASALDDAPVHLREIPPAEGRWSVAGVLEHLVQTEGSVTKLLSRLLERTPPRAPGEPFAAEAFSAHVEMPLLLDRGRRLRGSQPAGRLGASEAWSALGRTREELISVIERGAGLRLEDISFAHPFAGELDLYRWIAFVGLHEARHAAQIREIVDQLRAGGNG